MKILIYDIETTPILGYTWSTFKTDVIDVVQDWQMICFAYKWYDKKKIHFVRPEKGDPWNDKAMVQQLWDLFNEADVIVGHNVDRFDIRKANALFFRHGLTPPSPFKSVDTLKVARKAFHNSSNRLDALGQLVGIGRKKQTQGYMELFKGTMLADSPSGWKTMREYNLQDVKLTEDLYVKLLPWIKSHPIDLDNPDGCPTCGSLNLQRRGFRDLKSFRYPRYYCNDCGSWHRGRARIPIIKPKLI